MQWWRQAWNAVFGSQDPASIVEVLGVLPDRTANLGGRSELVAEILRRATPGQVIALVGMPGVGKTQLAIHCAQELIGTGRYGDLQMSVDLRGFDRDDRPPANPGAVLDQLLRRLGVQGPLSESLEVKVRSYQT